MAALLPPETVFRIVDDSVIALSVIKRESPEREDGMASEKQRRAAKKNIKKAIGAAKKKKTLKHLPKKTRTALGKQGAKMRKKKHGK